MAHRPDSLVIHNRVRIQNDAQKKIFLNILERVHTVRVAIRISGLSSEVVYRWKKEDAQFAEDWANAVEYSKDALESAAYLKLAQAYNDQRRRISAPEERLTEFLLSGMKPDKYRQRLDIEATHLNITIEWADVPDAVLAEFNAGNLTLQDVYEIALQSKEQQTTASSADRRTEGSGAT